MWPIGLLGLIGPIGPIGLIGLIGRICQIKQSTPTTINQRPMTDSFLPQRGNYRNLKAYQKAECVYDVTF